MLPHNIFTHLPGQRSRVPSAASHTTLRSQWTAGGAGDSCAQRRARPAACGSPRSRWARHGINDEMDIDSELKLLDQHETEVSTRADSAEKTKALASMEAYRASLRRADAAQLRLADAQRRLENFRRA